MEQCKTYIYKSKSPSLIFKYFPFNPLDLTILISLLTLNPFLIPTETVLDGKKVVAVGRVSWG